MKCSVHPSSNKGPSALMDACVWSNLPQDLLDRVLAFLPLKSLLRLRCVCRRWCLLVRTPKFLAVRSNISCYDPWLLMFKRQDYGICRVFEESNCKWHRMGLSFLPYRVRDVLAAASSLLCFGTDDPEILIVCNPLTKTWKALPPMRCRRSQGVVGMAVNRKIDMYNIIVARDVSHEHSRRTEVYDSRVNEWKITSALPPKTLLRRDTVLWNGILYLLSVEPFKLLAYDFAKETWCNLPALFPGSLIFSSLVLSQNILFLVGGVGSNGISKTVYIWQMTAAKVE